MPDAALIIKGKQFRILAGIADCPSVSVLPVEVYCAPFVTQVAACNKWIIIASNQSLAAMRDPKSCVFTDCLD